VKFFFQHAVFDITRLEGRRILDIGCGRNKLPGATGLDYLDLPGVDIISDLSKRLPFEDSEFDVVHSNQVLEHVPNMIGLIGEVHRILKPGGIMFARVPHFRSSWAAVDPTHIRNFTLLSLNYFVKGTHEYENYRFFDAAFSSIEVYLDDDCPPGPFRLIFTSIARRWPYRFENTVLSFLYPFQTLTFVLAK
jgi:2-polyprenyl-3-methyl-5-hydroxy-6-metoxy-1,4-benzoquinol methylase